jgi:hypothetical protein
MSDMPACSECSAGEQEPCTPECRCLHCQLQSIPVPTTMEACLREANKASFEGREFDAQLYMVRLRHIGMGHQ